MVEPFVPEYQREFHRRRAVSDVISLVKAKRGAEETRERVEAILVREGDAAKVESVDAIVRAAVGFFA